MEQDDDLNENDAGHIMIPRWFRFIGVVLAVVLMTPGVILIWRQVRVASEAVPATDSGTVQLMIAGVIVALASLAPVDKLRLRLRKVGWFEFDRVINRQAKEHVDEFVELRARIEELEQRTRGLDEVAPIVEYFTELDLSPLLLRFLSEFRPKAFSPLRIVKWGGVQSGFEGLAKFSQGQVRITLQKMVSQGSVATKVSKLGNTLYRAN
ncbi:MAG: hypothetical protein QM808_00280 [Steroidobacteraceae bacterium]